MQNCWTFAFAAAAFSTKTCMYKLNNMVITSAKFDSTSVCSLPICLWRRTETYFTKPYQQTQLTAAVARDKSRQKYLAFGCISNLPCMHKLNVEAIPGIKLDGTGVCSLPICLEDPSNTFYKSLLVKLVGFGSSMRPISPKIFTFSLLHFQLTFHTRAGC